MIDANMNTLDNSWVLKPNGLWEPTVGTGSKMPCEEVGFSLVNRDFKDESGAWTRVWVDGRVIDKDGGIPVGTVGWK